jgi:hypothetical protein
LGANPTGVVATLKMSHANLFIIVPATGTVSRLRY